MSGQGTLIPDLTLADVLASDDELVVEQSGATKRFLASELSRHVMTTAAGGNGAEDGANTWCKICDISLNTGTDADLPISLKFLASQQANGGSMDAEVFIRQTGGVGIAGTSYINVTAIHGVDTFSPDSLKLISNAEGSAQLWLRKDSNFNTIYVYEIGKGGFNEAATPISYNNNAAWQSATPSGAVNITGTYIDSVNSTATINFSSDADLSPTSAQLVNQFLIITDTGTVLTTGRNVILSDDTRTWVVTNSTTQTLTFKTSGGTGIPVDAGKSAILRGDGTHIDYHLTGFMGDLEGGSLSGSSITGLTSLSVGANAPGNVARYVMETAPGGASDSGYYALLKTWTVPTSGSVSYENGRLLIGDIVRANPVGGDCDISYFFRCDASGNLDANNSYIHVNRVASTEYAHDGFFLVQDSAGTVELYMQKQLEFSHFSVHEMFSHDSAVSGFTWNDGATWSATDPTSGAAVSVTSDWAGKDTFTPTLLFGGASTGITYSAQQGEYYINGPLIFFTVRLVLTSKGTSTGNAVVGNFPETFAADPRSVVTMSTYLVTYTTGATRPVARIGPSSTTIALLTEGSGITGAQLTDTEFSNNSQIVITGSGRLS